MEGQKTLSNKNPKIAGSSFVYSYEARMEDYSERLRNILTPYEGKLIYLQGLLVWEIPLHSLLWLVIVNGLFWLATYLRIYYLVGIVGFCLYSWELWSCHIWPEIRVPLPLGLDPEEWTPVHPDMLGVPEISHHLAKVIVRIEHFFHSAYHLRQAHPAKFFIWAMLLFISFGVVGHYIKGIYIVYSVVMGCLLLPSVYYYNLTDKLQDHINPLVKQMEDTMNIKRKRSKKGKKGAEGSKMADYSDSDEEIDEFVPQDMGLLSIKTKPSETDEESTGLTPRLLTPQMPEVGPDHDLSDDDSTYGDMPSQMPSVLTMDDSLSNDFRLSDFPDNSSNSNNNVHQQQLHFGGRIQAMDTHDDTDDADVTLHDDEASLSIASSDVVRDDSVTETDTASHENTESAKNLEFVSQHFKESSDEDDESKLVRGLEFPDVDNENQLAAGDDTSNGAQGALGFISNLTQGSGQQMGAILAGALSGAQDTVSNMVASQMVTSLMQNTVAGISKLSGTTKPSAKPTSSSVKAVFEGQGKVKLEGQGSRDSDAEFEFLSQEDFETIEKDN